MSKRRIVLHVTTAFALAAAGSALAQTPVGTAFTYQAQLKQGGEPLNDTADFKFTLWDAPEWGGQIGDEVSVPDVDVVNGLILMPIDLDVAPWTSDTAYWLEIQVRSPSGMGDFVTLEPRQRVTPTPHSLSTRGIIVNEVGDVGIGTSTPQAKLHVRASNLPPLRGGYYDPEQDELLDDIAAAARLEVYSGNTGVGNFGSGIVLTEDNTDKWALLRHIATAGSGLIMTYGANADPITNNPMLEIQALGNTLLNPMVGYTGIAETAPYTQLHVTSVDIPYDFSTWLSSEEVVLEDDNKPWLGLYTGNEQEGFGAGITLGEVLAGQRDKWSIFRQDQNGQTYLGVTWGQNADPTANYARMRIWQGGDTLLAPVAGKVGVGFDYEPLAKLHVVQDDLSIDYSASLAYEDIIVADVEDNAWLGLYSNDGGGIVSGITFAEVPDDGSDVNKWAIYRRTTSNVGDLCFSFGTDPLPGHNPKVLQLRQDGETWVKDLVADGEIFKRYTPGTKDPAAPLAYGKVSALGNLVSGTENVSSVAWNGTYQRYEISITGVWVNHLDHVILLTTNSQNQPTFATAYSGSGDLWVTCWNAVGGVKTDEGFSFVIYAPTD